MAIALPREQIEAILADPAFEEALVEVLRQSPELAERVPGSFGSLTPPELAVLQESGLVNPEKVPFQPLVRAILIFGQLLADSRTTTEVAQLLRVDGARIRQRLSERTLFGIKGVGAEWRLPNFQFSLKGEVPHLGQVFKALPSDLHPVEVFNWLTLPEPELDLHGEEVSPLQWLLSGGRPDPVIEIAEQMAQDI